MDPMTTISAGDLKLLRKQLERYPIEYTHTIMSVETWKDILLGSDQPIIDAISKDPGRLESCRTHRNYVPIRNMGETAAFAMVPGITEYYLTIGGVEHGVCESTFKEALELVTEIPETSDFEWSEE